MQNQLKLGLCCVFSLMLSACGQTGALTLAKEGEYDTRSQYLLFKPKSEQQANSQPVSEPVSSE